MAEGDKGEEKGHLRRRGRRREKAPEKGREKKAREADGRFEKQRKKATDPNERCLATASTSSGDQLAPMSSWKSVSQAVETVAKEGQ